MSEATRKLQQSGGSCSLLKLTVRLCPANLSAHLNVANIKTTFCVQLMPLSHDAFVMGLNSFCKMCEIMLKAHYYRNTVCTPTPTEPSHTAVNGRHVPSATVMTKTTPAAV